jgi:phenylalanyl-tRNA synthetase beta chain
MIGQAKIGVVGQVHPSLATHFGIERDAFLFEIDLEALLANLPQRVRYQRLLRFPAVEQDLAIVVGKEVPAAGVRSLIERSPLVRRANLFDVYEGPPLAAEKKSLAFSVSFQSPERTLTDADVDRERQRLVEQLRRELGAELRV